MSIKQAHSFFKDLLVKDSELFILEPVRDAILRRTTLLMKLGAGHLSLNRESPSLSSGEAQRIRLANHASGGLRNTLYILDEPSAGLHPSEHRQLLEVLRSLVSSGNTVILVDHDEQSIREADWIVDMGPGAGAAGGKILFNGTAEAFFGQVLEESLTRKYLGGIEGGKIVANTDRAENVRIAGSVAKERSLKKGYEVFLADGACKNNLRHISPRFLLHAFNVITGVSGSGKTSLVSFMIEKTIPEKSGGTGVFKKVIHIDSTPIGRTPNSNPATYTGLSDHVRDLLALLPDSQARGYKKGQFSFVVKGGRCERCGGAGIQQIGMHFLGNMEVICDVCEGRRFTDDTLEIKYKGLNIFNILDEPTTGLHMADIETLMKALKKLTRTWTMWQKKSR